MDERMRVVAEGVRAGGAWRTPSTEPVVEGSDDPSATVDELGPTGGSTPSPLRDLVLSTAPRSAPGRDYPIEDGVPHPRWKRDPGQLALADARIGLDATRATSAILLIVAIAAFVLGLAIFWPVTALPT
jgi:hypothetical protein